MFCYPDDKTVKYNLSTGQVIGKKGQPVTNLCTQLRGYTIDQLIESIEDKNYAAFLKRVVNYANQGSYVTNFGTILKYAKKLRWLEQYYACGIYNVDIHFNYNLSDVPKGLLKIVKQFGLCLDLGLYDVYNRLPNQLSWALNEEWNFLSLNNIVLLFETRYQEMCNGAYKRDKYGRYVYIYTIDELISKYNYDYKALLHYIDNLAAYEGMENPYETLRELKDYVEMMNRLSPKFEKYPKNFLTTHRIASRNYNRLKQQFIEDDFKKMCRPEYNCRFEDYIFIYPKSTQDIKDEAVQQCNCVASYIQKVIDGQCHILFLRKKDEPSKSLITIEVRNGRIVQAKGKFNRDITDDERYIVEKFNNKFRKAEAM